MDREGEQELVATLKTLAVDHTAIVMSHSPALLSACDQVLVMQRGRVVRSGRPEDVLPPQLLVGAMSLSLLKFVGQASLVDDAMLPS